MPAQYHCDNTELLPGQRASQWREKEREARNCDRSRDCLFLGTRVSLSFPNTVSLREMKRFHVQNRILSHPERPTYVRWVGFVVILFCFVFKSGNSLHLVQNPMLPQENHSVLFPWDPTACAGQSLEPRSGRNGHRASPRRVLLPSELSPCLW